ncbi:MAG: radical SAM protein [Verrucomicrobiota bacterium]|nr:radical SAM protein [Verrucomicrobiota bacterium]
MMDVVFVNPPLSQEERYGIKFKAGGQTPPTGLAVLAAVLREKGRAVAIVDAPAENLDHNGAAEKALSFDPRIVGITAVTVSIFNAHDVARQIKAKAPDKTVILGGPHLTAVPEETMKRLPAFDIGVLGEGEITMTELADALLGPAAAPLDKIPGLILRAADGFRITTRRPFIEDLDRLPFPAWDILPDLAVHYCPPVHTLKRTPAALVIPTRGCPGTCVFCDKRVFGRRMRAHSADYIVRMLLRLKQRYGIREIQFRDDNFLAFRRVLREFCERMISERVDMTWSCAGRVDMINEETLRLMKQAGCWQIWYGVESGSDRILKVIKKNTTIEMITQAVTLTAQAGIHPCGFFMIGNPTETEDDARRTIALLLKLPFSEFHMCHFTPLPGSEIYPVADQYGKFDNDWRNLTCWTTAFVPHTISEKKLVYYANLAFRKFYFRPRIVFSYLRRIDSPRKLRVFFVAFLGFLQYVLQKRRSGAEDACPADDSAR